MDIRQYVADGIHFAAEANRYASNARANVAAVLPIAMDVDDFETRTSDLLADLMHVCRTAGIEFMDLVGRAEMHFDAEIQGVV